MALRAFDLPADIPLLVDLIPPCFQYPENEEWNIQQDEVENMIDSLNGARRMWPLIRLVMLLSPPMRDMLRGYVWEEDGHTVGLTNVIRMGNTDQWLIGNVGVLPDYRRRGIARKLVDASVAFARERGAQSIVLDVIDGNVPAYNLYLKLGFEHYSGQTQLVYDAGAADAPLPDVALPDGYTIEPYPLFDWRPRFELAKRITPEVDQRYTPVEEGRFRQPPIVRVLLPFIDRAMGARNQVYVLRRTPSGEPVGFVRGFFRVRAGGVNTTNITLDPAHAEAAPYVVNFVLRDFQKRSPGRRIESVMRQWQAPVIDTMLAAGFTRVADMHTMGMII